MDPIEISSSDSDFDWGDEEEDAAPPSMPSVASTSYRVLPDWASTSGPRGQSQQVSSVRGLNGNSKFSESHQFSNGANTQPLNAHIISVDDTRNSKGNGGAAGRVHSAKSDRTLEGNSSRNAYDQTAIQQSVKRTLPSSLQPSLPVPRKNYSFDSEGSNQILGNGRSMHSPMPTGLTSRNYKKDNDVVMHDNPRSRVLPPSLMHGRSLSSSPYAGSSDPVYHSGVADERVSGPDERFVYQAALQDLSQPRIEANLPDGLLSVPLLRHQKIALAWMLQRESRTFCVGGILADDQGLGKTISTIALIEMQRYLLLKAKSEEQGNHKAEAFNLDDDEDGHNAESLTLLDDESTSAASAPNTLESENPDPVKRHSKKASSSRQASSKKRPAAGTLIVCPATVLRQWARELDDKVADEGKLSILVYHGGNRTRDPSELAKYDVVLTTYSIITNEVPKQPLVDEEDGELKNGTCGVCHTDLHQAKNDLGMSRYPMVPGHEVVGEVLEVGSGVSKFKVGDRIGVGCIVGCCRNCLPCKTEEEQYCNKKIWSYNDVYTDGKTTQGGFAETMVVDQKFAVHIPEGMQSEQAAPLLCAGVTVYSPLKHFGLTKPGLKGGILGLGGVGHMGVKIAKAMGHNVTVISSSEKKRVEAIDHLGADSYLVGSDAEKMGEVADTLDYIIDTVPVNHPLEPYLTLLKLHGKLILMGVISTPLQFMSPVVMLGRKTITGSFIGSIKETEEMLEFCKEKNVTSQIEVVKMDYINEAFERLEKNDVRYRFVVDVAGSKL